jgi:hypothetical protein
VNISQLKLRSEKFDDDDDDDDDDDNNNNNNNNNNELVTMLRTAYRLTPSCSTVHLHSFLSSAQ